MAKIEFKELDKYMKSLENLSSRKQKDIIEHSLYHGAKVIADEIKKEMEGLPTAENMHKGVTDIEKKDMIDGFGISPMRNQEGTHDVKIGFDGYGSSPTKRFPKGVPIPLTVRSIISGTSFRKKNNFIQRAVNRTKKKAIEKMDEVLNEKIEKEMK